MITPKIIFSYFLSALLITLIYGIYKSTGNLKQSSDRLSQLQDETNRLRVENMRLKDDITSIKSYDYIKKALVQNFGHLSSQTSTSEPKIKIDSNSSQETSLDLSRFKIEADKTNIDKWLEYTNLEWLKKVNL